MGIQRWKDISNCDYKLNPKTEVKNIGSITAVEKAIEYEVKRMIDELEEGKELIQQTRGWNASRGVTEFQRSKEKAEDYGYAPDPDIPIIDVSKEDIERIKKELIELPTEKIKVCKIGTNRYAKCNLSSKKC